MSNYAVGNVAVGLKRIEIRAVTDEIFMRPLADGPCPHIVVRHPLAGAQEWPIGNKVRAVGFEAGDRASLFWCARGENESDWAAGYNHRTGRFGVSEFGINELIKFPFHNFWVVVAIFGGLLSFGAGPGVILLMPIPIGFFIWISRRHKKVRRAIETALEEIKRRDSSKPAPVAEPDLDFRLKTS